MEKIMAVWDVDTCYAERFADVVNQKEKVPFTVVPFTSLEALKEYAKGHVIEILLGSAGKAAGRDRGQVRGHAGRGGDRVLHRQLSQCL